MTIFESGPEEDDGGGVEKLEDIFDRLKTYLPKD